MVQEQWKIDKLSELHNILSQAIGDRPHCGAADMYVNQLMFLMELVDPGEDLIGNSSALIPTPQCGLHLSL